MTLDALIMLLGTFVAVLPFLGFPNSWDNILFLVTGIVIVMLGIVVRRRTSNAKANLETVQRALVEKAPLDLTDVQN